MPKHTARRNSPISTISYWLKHAVDEVKKVKWGKKESSCQEVADFQVKGKKPSISIDINLSVPSEDFMS